MQHIQGWHSRTVGILQSLKICGILMLLPCLQLTKFTIDQRKCGFPQLRCLDSAGIYHQPQASSGVYPSAPSVCNVHLLLPTSKQCPLSIATNLIFLSLAVDNGKDNYTQSACRITEENAWAKIVVGFCSSKKKATIF